MIAHVGVAAGISAVLIQAFKDSNRPVTLHPSSPKFGVAKIYDFFTLLFPLDAAAMYARKGYLVICDCPRVDLTRVATATAIIAHLRFIVAIHFFRELF